MSGEPLANGRQEIHTLNVGQADSHAIITEDGKLNLIDADTTNVGDELDSLLDGRTTPETESGYIPIETFAVTHLHYDHSDGVETLHDHGYEIQHVVEPDENRYAVRDRETGKPRKGVKATVSNAYANGLKKHGVKNIRQVSEGDSLFPDMDSQVLAPPDESGTVTVTSPVTGRKNTLKPTGANANSTAVKTDSDPSVLFMGDVEDTGGLNGETQLMHQHDSDESNVDLDADILVISHHGSDNATSEAFLERVDPEMAIISSSLDDDNNNDHPRDAVLEQLHDREIDVYWTAVHGTLHTDQEEGVAADPTATHDTTNAADLAAVKHYCRATDVTPEDIDTLAPGNIPDETPEWITDAAPMIAETPEEIVDAAITNAENVAEVHQTLKDSHPANRHLYKSIQTDRNEHVTDAGTVRDNRRARRTAKRNQAAAQPSWRDRVQSVLPFVADPDVPEYDGPAPDEIEGPFTEEEIADAVTDSRTAKTMRDDVLTDESPPDYLLDAEEQANTAVNNAENAEELFEGLRDTPGAHSDMMKAIETSDTHIPEGLVSNERDNTQAIAQNQTPDRDRGLGR